MTKAFLGLVIATCIACSADKQGTDDRVGMPAEMPAGHEPSTDSDAHVANAPSEGGSVDSPDSGNPQSGDSGAGRADALVPDSSPKIGAPGCGFAAAAFCDTFDRPATVRGRGGDLNSAFWSAGRMQVQQSTTRAMGIGMAVIPGCRPGVSNHVWPNDDSLICETTADVASPHLLVAVAAQNYGQNGYRIRQPFDFAARTGKIVFDGAAEPLSPLHGWISLAITEDPISMPGYSILHNDEGTIIPKNAVEVHFMNAPGDTGIVVYHVHVFKDYVDTVYTPPTMAPASYKRGKLNHFEVAVSEQGIEATITPYSENGVSFAAPAVAYQVKTTLPFSRGYVQLSVHNHATLKYTTAPNSVDASVARFDNVGFDGKVVANFREYEVPNSLVKFQENLGDPYNTENVGYDIGYVMQDASKGPKQILHFQGVDTANVKSAKLSFSTWLDFFAQNAPRDQYTVRARLNGKSWLERKLTAQEAAFLSTGPTTVDPSGAKIGDPGSQGRYALTIDVPVEQLVPGDNTVEFVSANIPTSYPPGVCNIDLVLETK